MINSFSMKLRPFYRELLLLFASTRLYILRLSLGQLSGKGKQNPQNSWNKQKIDRRNSSSLITCFFGLGDGESDAKTSFSCLNC